MKLGEIWNEVYDAYYNRGVRMHRLGVTHCRRYTYDYDALMFDAWKHWTKR